MSEYLRYICEIESVPVPGLLYVVHPRGEWMIEQLTCELENVFPDVPIQHLSTSELPGASGLLVIGYDVGLPNDLYSYLLRLCNSGKHDGLWVFLYDMRYRCIHAGTVASLWQSIRRRQGIGRILRILERLHLVGPLVRHLERSH